MKSLLVPFLPLLLIACASDGPVAETQPEPSPARALSKVEPAAPTVTSMPETSTSAPKSDAHAHPAPVAEAPAAGQAPATTPDAPATATTPDAPATRTTPDAPATAPAVEKPAPRPQVPTVQLPTTPPLALPVVLGPPATVDPQTLSSTNLGGPIRVFGKTIDEQELRRYLCYSVGGKQLDSMKFDVICQQEIDKRRAAGEDVSQLEISDADFDKAMEKTRKDFLLRYPTLDFPTEVGRAYLSLDVYKKDFRRTMRFDRTFFPPDPETWPSVTTEAIVQASGGPAFVDDSKESYATRKKMKDDQGLDELPPEDPILVDTLRSWLLETLNQFAQFESNPTKLPPDTLLVIEGVPIKVDTLWNVIQPYVTWENVADTRRFLTQIAVVEHELEQRNMVLPVEEFEKNFMPNIPYKDALASYEMVALVLYGFPSMAADLRYERMLRSYRKLIADELASNDSLQPFMQRANMIAGAARIDSEVILASSFDFPNARWPADGWTRAEAKARQLKQMLDSGANWGDTLELHSDYWDPPMPEVGQKPQFGFNFKGRFGPQTRNQLVSIMHESDFSLFLRGRGNADAVFFEQPGGSISDVMKGPRGYYIARVNSRTPANAGLNLQVPQNREFAVNFVAMLRFGVYARQLLTDALAKGDVTGF